MGLSKVPDGVTPEMMLSVLRYRPHRIFWLLNAGRPKAGVTVRAGPALLDQWLGRLRGLKAAALLALRVDLKNARG